MGSFDAYRARARARARKGLRVLKIGVRKDNGAKKGQSGTGTKRITGVEDRSVKG
jgi:hypothetical protein